MREINLAEVKEAGVSTRLPAGGYVCKYTAVTDVADKEYLYMEFDVVEGEYAGYFKDLETRLGFWGGNCYRSYKENALPMFKRMCSAVTKSNPGFIFDGGKQNANEATLVGKYVGIVFGEEEYIGNDGSLKTRLKVSYECDINDIRNKKFKVPQIKKLITEPLADDGFMKIPEGTDEEIPFN